MDRFYRQYCRPININNFSNKIYLKFLVFRLYILCFLGRCEISTGIIRNCGKWSEMEVIKLPEVHVKKFIEFEKILSIIFVDVGVTLVGRIIRGTDIFASMASRNTV